MLRKAVFLLKLFLQVFYAQHKCRTFSCFVSELLYVVFVLVQNALVAYASTVYCDESQAPPTTYLEHESPCKHNLYGTTTGYR